MARSKPTQTSAPLAEQGETAVRYWRLPGGGLLRSQATPPSAAGPPPDGAVEIDQAEYDAAHGSSEAARGNALAAAVDADRAAVRARYDELRGLGAGHDLAASLTGHTGPENGTGSGGE